MNETVTVGASAEQTPPMDTVTWQFYFLWIAFPRPIDTCTFINKTTKWKIISITGLHEGNDFSIDRLVDKDAGVNWLWCRSWKKGCQETVLTILPSSGGDASQKLAMHKIVETAMHKFRTFRHLTRWIPCTERASMHRTSLKEMLLCSTFIFTFAVLCHPVRAWW